MDLFVIDWDRCSQALCEIQTIYSVITIEADLIQAMDTFVEKEEEIL